MAFLALAVLLLPQSGEREHAFVDLAAQHASVFVEQPIRLTIRVGVEEEYLRHNLLQLFTRPLEVPVQLELPWEAGLAGALPLEPGQDASGADALVERPSFALGEEITRAARSTKETREGRTWIVLEIERALLPLAPGRLEIPGPLLHFAFATRFDQDLVSGSVPLDRRTAVVRAAPLALEVVPLPEAGRPAGFVDAVGQFTLEAQAEPRELEAGGTLKFVLTITGRGNLGRLAPPRLDALPGLHLQGRTDELHGSTRTLACDLTPDSQHTREIPAITLEYFDPDARAYRRASTQPIPLGVKARAPYPAPVGFAAAGSVRWMLGIAALVLLAVAWGIVRLVRSRRN
jgi:hypothetical protein